MKLFYQAGYIDLYLTLVDAHTVLWKVSLWHPFVKLSLHQPCRAYQLATSGSCDSEGCAVTGPGSTSACIASGGIGQSTYPYYSLDSIVNDGDYEGSTLMDDTWVDADEFYQVLTLADGMNSRPTASGFRTNTEYRISCRIRQRPVSHQ